jgi:oligoendopeptidase F
MPTLARFELELHELAEQGEALTAAVLNDLMAIFLQKAMAPSCGGPGSHRQYLAQFSTHLYANFYVYQYATGIAVAHALALGSALWEPGAVDRYLEFLRAGGSRYPLDVLRQAVVRPVLAGAARHCVCRAGSYVERLEQLPP